MTPLDVIVVGGGLSGLTAGYRLRQQGLRVRVLEAQMTPGGNAQTDVVDGVLFERGPHTFPQSADVLFELANELGIDDQLTVTDPRAHNRFIVRNGRVHPLPHSIWSFLRTPLLSIWAKLTILMEPIRSSRPGENDSVHDFFSRRLGDEAATVLAGSFVSGIYAGDAHALSAPAAFPLLWRFEQTAGSLLIGAWRHFSSRATRRSGLYSFDQGMGVLARAIAEKLDDSLLLNTPADAISYADDCWHVTSGNRTFSAPKIVVAIPPNHASALLAASASDVSTLLDEIPMAPIAVVHLAYDQRLPTVPNGFGMLVVPGEAAHTLGVLFPSRLFANRVPKSGDLLTAYVGGVNNPDALDLSDENLVAKVQSDLFRFTHIHTPATTTRVQRITAAIPQFNQGHQARNERLCKALSAHSGLLLAGNYLRGVGLKDALQSGIDAASAAVQ